MVISAFGALEVYRMSHWLNATLDARWCKDTVSPRVGSVALAKTWISGAETATLPKRNQQQNMWWCQLLHEVKVYGFSLHIIFCSSRNASNKVESTWKLHGHSQSNHLCPHASARNPSSSAAAPVQRWCLNSNIRCFPECPGFFFSPSIHSIQQCTTHQVTLAFCEERGKGRFQEISLIILWPRTTVCMDLTPTKIIISMVHTLKWSEIEIISATLLKITSVPNCDALLHQHFSTPLAACALARLGWSFKASTASWKASWWSQALD